MPPKPPPFRSSLVGLARGVGRVLVFAATVTCSGAPTGPADTGPPAATLARVVVLSGQGQTGPAGSVLPQPLVVEAEAADGTPVAGVQVQFVADGGGSVNPTSATTGTDGRAQTTMTLGPGAGPQQFGVEANGTTVLANADTAMAHGAAAIVADSGNAQRDTVGRLLTRRLVVRVTDSLGNGVAGAAVRWRRVAGTGQLSDSTASADATGRAGDGYTLGSTAGTDTIVAVLAADTSLRVRFSETGIAGAPASIVRVAGDGLAVSGGGVVPVAPTVKVTDAHGNGDAGIPVSFAVTAGGGSVTGAAATTDSTGRASVGQWTIGATGVQQLTASAAGLTTTFTATIRSAADSVVATAVAPPTDTLDALGVKVRLTATARSSTGSTSGYFTWTSRAPSVATVDDSGTVTAAGNGEAWIVATEVGGTRDSALIVVQQRAAAVTITPATCTLHVAATCALTALRVDGGGHPMSDTATFTWSTSNRWLATVSDSGVVTGVAPGTVQISAQGGGVSGTATVTVRSAIVRIDVGRDASGVPVTDTTPLTAVGRTRTFVAVARDSAGNALHGISFDWTSLIPAVAALDSITDTTARATADSSGWTSIAASAQGVTGSIGLPVRQVPASIHLAPDTVFVAPGGSAGLTATGIDSTGHAFTGLPVTYHSASVAIAAFADSTSGRVTGVAAGTTYVTAASGGVKSDTAVVVVTPAAAIHLSFARDTIYVPRGTQVTVPLQFSASNGLTHTVKLAVGDSIASWSPDSVSVWYTMTTFTATITGRVAGTTTVSATVSNDPSVIGDTAVLVVEPGVSFPVHGNTIDQGYTWRTSVQLSDPAPAPGTMVHFQLAPTGFLSAVPDSVLVPTGQLTASVAFDALIPGTTIITPTSPGFVGVPISVTVDSLIFELDEHQLFFGAGQLDSTLIVREHYPAPDSLVVGFVSSAPAVAAPSPSVVIHAGSTGWATYRVIGVSPGVATVTPVAPGWITPESLAVTVTTPYLSIPLGGGTFAPTASIPGLGIYTADSTLYEHPVAAPLTVHVRSTNPSVIRVVDSTVTVAEGTEGVSAPLANGGTLGSAWVVATAAGWVADSTKFTVGSPQVSLSGSTHVGVGQVDSSVTMGFTGNTNPALPVTLMTPDPEILGIASATTAGNPKLGVQGKQAGSALVVVSAPGYVPDSATYTVTTPELLLDYLGTLQVGVTSAHLRVATADSMGMWHPRTTALSVSLTSTNPSVLGVAASATVPAGSMTVSTIALNAVSAGSAAVIATATGYKPDTLPVTVAPAAVAPSPQLTFSFGTWTVGVGQHDSADNFNVSIGAAVSAPVTVTITQLHPAVDSVPAELQIPVGSSSAVFGDYAHAAGVDTIIASAPGYAPDTAYIDVIRPAFGVGVLNYGNNSTVLGGAPITDAVIVADTTGHRHFTNGVVVAHAVSSDSTVVRVATPYVHIPAGSQIAALTLDPVSVGQATFTVSDSGATLYKSATSPTVTVNPRSASFSTTMYILGKRQESGPASVNLTAGPDTAARVFALTSSDPTVASVPDSLVVPGGATMAYFPIVAHDNAGTVQLQATAPGYNTVTMAVQVTTPWFGISTGTTAATTFHAQTIEVMAEDSLGRQHPVAEDVPVHLAVADTTVASVDSSTLTIAAGTSNATGATWSPVGGGSTVLIASDLRAVPYAYHQRAVALTVTVPSLSVVPKLSSMGIGQYYHNVWVRTPYVLASGGTVTLATAGTPGAVTVSPASVTIAPNTQVGLFDLIGAGSGTDTVVASLASPYHYPDSLVVTVGPGRLDPITNWPSSVSAGDSVLVTLSPRTPAGDTATVHDATTFTLAAGASIAFSSGNATVSSVTIPAGGQSVQFYVKALKSGTATVTISAPNYTTFTSSILVP